MKTGIGSAESTLLRHFGQLIHDAWGESGYLVGSSQITGPGFRDVDVRVMVTNEEFARMFPGTPWQSGRRHNDPCWRAQMLAWAMLGRQLTGLPIDFQVERQTESDALWPTQPRNPLGLWTYGSKILEPESEAIEANLPEVSDAVDEIFGFTEEYLRRNL